MPAFLALSGRVILARVGRGRPRGESSRRYTPDAILLLVAVLAAFPSAFVDLLVRLLVGLFAGFCSYFSLTLPAYCWRRSFSLVGVVDLCPLACVCRGLRRLCRRPQGGRGRVRGGLGLRCGLRVGLLLKCVLLLLLTAAALRRRVGPIPKQNVSYFFRFESEFSDLLVHVHVGFHLLGLVELDALHPYLGLLWPFDRPLAFKTCFLSLFFVKVKTEKCCLRVAQLNTRVTRWFRQKSADNFQK